MKQITYVYDPDVETYRRIVEEHETSYLISNFLGAKYSIDKPENPDLITLTIAPVGTQVYHTEHKIYGRRHTSIKWSNNLDSLIDV